MGARKPYSGASWRGDLFFAGALILVSGAAGQVINGWRAQPLPSHYATKGERLERSVQAIVPSKTPEPLPIKVAVEVAPADLSLKEFQEFAKARRGLVLDARPAIFYRLGHVPYALSLPREGFDKAYAQLRGKLESDLTVPLAVYCSSATCEDSELVQKALQKIGFTHVAVFRGGWAEWTDAHLPEERLP